MEIQFNFHFDKNHETLGLIDVRDIMHFVNIVTREERFKKCKTLSANIWSKEDDKVNLSMTTITITFQVWNRKESGRGRRFKMIIYRAKTHCCSNTEIKEYPFDSGLGFGQPLYDFDNPLAERTVDGVTYRICFTDESARKEKPYLLYSDKNKIGEFATLQAAKDASII